MFYHITPVENKESILKEGLHSKRDIYLAKTYYDAFVLAPITEQYMYLYKVKDRIQNAYLYNWEKAKLSISVFQVDEEGLEITEHYNACYDLLSRFNIILDDFKDLETRQVYEYTTECVPPQNIKWLYDLDLEYLQLCLIPREEIAKRIKERMDLTNNGMSSKDVNKYMRDKYIPDIKSTLPELEPLTPVTENSKIDTKFIEAANMQKTADIINAFDSHSFDEIPEILEMQKTKYYQWLLEEYKGIRINLLYKSSVHGQSHIERVLLLGALIAYKRNLSQDHTKLLLTACAYHDIGRRNDFADTPHGLRAAKMLMQLPVITDAVFSKEILCAIVAGHSCTDGSIDYFMQVFNIDDTLKDVCIDLYYCLKDADNLDRVRIMDLKPRYLRNEISKTLVETAKQIYSVYPDFIRWKNLEKAKEKAKEMQKSLSKTFEKLKINI